MGDRRNATSTGAGILRPDQLADHVDIERGSTRPEVELDPVVVTG